MTLMIIIIIPGIIIMILIIITIIQFIACCKFALFLWQSSGTLLSASAHIQPWAVSGALKGAIKNVQPGRLVVVVVRVVS